MIRKLIEKIGAGGLFLIAVVLLYVIFGAIDIEIALAGLKAFLKILWKILPTFAIVMGLLFLFNLLIDTKVLVRILGKGAGKWGWLIAVVTGIISTGPIYLWYPLLSDLKEKGMREAFMATFLYNRAVKVPLLPMMLHYFGLKLVAILSVYMILFSVFNGYLVEHILNKRR